MHDDVSLGGSGSREPHAMSRRRFLATTGAAGALLPAVAAGQTAAASKDTLRPVVDAAELAITDEQLGKLAGAVSWARGELRKLREVDVGIAGPAFVFLPAAPAETGNE